MLAMVCLCPAAMIPAVAAQGPSGERRESPLRGIGNDWCTLDRVLLVSTNIVRARLTLDDLGALERAASRNGGYVRIELVVLETLRAPGPGQAPDALTFFATPEGHPHGFHPTAPELRLHLGQERLLLLQRVGDRYFLADRFDGMSLVTPRDQAIVRERLERHERYAGTPLPDELPHASTVAGLVERVGGSDAASAEEAWLAILALGPDAVPALAAHLDDERQFVPGTIVLRAAPGAPAHALRVLRPELVCDALSIALGELCGDALGPQRADGVRPQARDSTRRWWLIRAHFALEALRESERRANQTRR